MDKLYTFEVTPSYPTRKVYDSVLYPHIDIEVSYEKQLTVIQALSAMNTCAIVKIGHEDKWYVVTPDTIDAATEMIDAGKAPELDEVKRGFRVLQSYITALEKTEDAYGKKAGELGDIRFENGIVYGTVYPAAEYTGFSSDEDEKAGYFLPFGWVDNTDFTDAKMRVINGKHPDALIALDPVNVIRLGDSVVDGGAKLIEITAKDADGHDVSVILSSAMLKFSSEGTPVIQDAKKEDSAPVPDTPAKESAKTPKEEDVVG